MEAHTWEHVSFEEINPALYFSPCECENNIQQDPCLFYNLETVLKSYGNHFPYKRRGIFFFKYILLYLLKSQVILKRASLIYSIYKTIRANCRMSGKHRKTWKKKTKLPITLNPVIAVTFFLSAFSSLRASSHNGEGAM